MAMEFYRAINKVGQGPPAICAARSSTAPLLPHPLHRLCCCCCLPCLPHAAAGPALTDSGCDAPSLSHSNFWTSIGASSRTTTTTTTWFAWLPSPPQIPSPAASPSAAPRASRVLPLISRQQEKMLENCAQQFSAAAAAKVKEVDFEGVKSVSCQATVTHLHPAPA